ncbi:MAG: LPXTG cell wall anchor domain-containing protein [Aerococcus sp.]|nr:LPXTG cell wall anchor domain-containing protein [Aerococcus sp.]
MEQHSPMKQLLLSGLVSAAVIAAAQAQVVKAETIDTQATDTPVVVQTEKINATEASQASESELAAVTPSEDKSVATDASEAEHSYEATTPNVDQTEAPNQADKDQETQHQPADPFEIAGTEDPNGPIHADKDENAQTPVPENGVEANKETIYMTTEHKETLQLKQDIQDLSQLEITFGGKNIKDLKQWNIESGKFDGKEAVITADQVESNQLVLYIKPLLGSRDLEERWPNNLRRTYRRYMGEFALTIKDTATGDLLYKKIYNLRPYEHFETYEEMVQRTDKVVQEAAKDRYVDIEVIGYSKEGRPIRVGYVANSKEDINRYLNELTPAMLKNPAEVLKQLKAGTLNYKLPIFIHNTHPDEQPAIDIVSSLFEMFAKQDAFTFKTAGLDATLVGKDKITIKGDQIQGVTFNVKDLLDKFFFCFTFTENPDGMFHNIRSSSTGLDINRDHGYQTQPESQAVAAQIAKFNPLTFLDFHGFQKEFLIEPCTPPHDPNFEYDLMKDLLLENAKSMGNTAIANSSYESYLIPMLNWSSGWDDDFSGYTAVFSVYHGAVGHTIELPEMNEDSYTAGVHAALGSILWALNNRERLFETKLKFFQRGIDEVDAPTANQELIAPDGHVVGRPQMPDGQFFPHYYVIPMNPQYQADTNEAFQMIDYFQRNGVIVKQLKDDMAGTNYKAGDLVIDMAQPKRGIANMALWRGSDDSAWDAMYAEIVVNFPVMRGFTVERVNTAKLFADKLIDVTWKEAPRITPAKAPYYWVDNNSLSVIQAVNMALHANKAVYRAEGGYYFTDDAFQLVKGHYALKAKAVDAVKMSKPALQSINVYAPGNPNIDLGYVTVSEATLALQQMDFEVVNNYATADVIVVDTGDYDTNWIGTKPMIFIGAGAIQAAIEAGKLPGIELGQTQSNHEGLVTSTINTQAGVASGYNKDGYFYTTSGAWLINHSDNFVNVMTLNSGSDAFLSGWWPEHDKALGRVVALDGMINGMPTFIYAGAPLNKMHTHYFYRWIANAILRGDVAKPMSESTVPNREENKQPHTQVVIVTQKQPEAVGVGTSHQAERQGKTATTTKTLPQTGATTGSTQPVALLSLLFGGFFFTAGKKKRQD